MHLEITVRGVARSQAPPDQLTVGLTIVAEGPDRAEVASRAAAAHGEISRALALLDTHGALRSWSAGTARVVDERPWANGVEGPPRPTARLGVEAEFADLEAGSNFVATWSARAGVQIDGLEWGLTDERRRALETAVRRSAVDDAVAKGQTLASAAGRGRVTLTRLADSGLLGVEPAVPLARALAVASGGDHLDLRPAAVVVEVAVDAVLRAD